MRPECRDSGGRGVDREGRENEECKEWENNKGLGERQNADNAIRMHTEATCVQPMKREEVYEPGNKSHVPQQWM